MSKLKLNKIKSIAISLLIFSIAYLLFSWTSWYFTITKSISIYQQTETFNYLETSKQISKERPFFKLFSNLVVITKFILIVVILIYAFPNKKLKTGSILILIGLFTTPFITIIGTSWIINKINKHENELIDLPQEIDGNTINNNQVIVTKVNVAKARKSSKLTLIFVSIRTALTVLWFTALLYLFVRAFPDYKVPSNSGNLSNEQKSLLKIMLYVSSFYIVILILSILTLVYGIIFCIEANKDDTLRTPLILVIVGFFVGSMFIIIGAAIGSSRSKKLITKNDLNIEN